MEPQKPQGVSANQHMLLYSGPFVVGQYTIGRLIGWNSVDWSHNEPGTRLNWAEHLRLDRAEMTFLPLKIIADLLMFSLPFALILEILTIFRKLLTLLAPPPHPPSLVSARAGATGAQLGCHQPRGAQPRGRRARGRSDAVYELHQRKVHCGAARQRWEGWK